MSVSLSGRVPARDIYWESQQSALCGCHCLNNLLQAPYFTPILLADIAAALNEAERQLMSESGVESSSYLTHVAADSAHISDTGDFSVEVIQSALSNVGLTMTPISAPSETTAHNDPADADGYILNLQSHWFALRKLYVVTSTSTSASASAAASSAADIWFNLNSLLSGPERISAFHLGVLLSQMSAEGYSVFAVSGNYPTREDDNIAAATADGSDGRLYSVTSIGFATANTTPEATPTITEFGESRRVAPFQLSGSDDDLAAALVASMNEDNFDDDQLRRAMALSLQTQQK